ncbi:DUF433 domain-containing protein [Azohydromonas australica]|uniref:DUF433 domain-containing protein n=1 Tax=Azohydromonas australica TaxID=364039 RepID=UPI0003FFEB17|nr:DUF433 domain-containing protein [Azohydromonas australica]
MAAQFALVPTAEAAFIAGLSDRQMNRVVDEHLVPEVLVGQQGSTRLFTRLCAAFARFYFDTEDLLIAAARRQVLEELTGRVTSSPAREAVLALAQVPAELSWKVERCAVEIDVAPYVSTALVRAREVDQAEALITTDAQVLGGAPVFAGTRVPIDSVLASLDAGIELPRLQDSFPFLTQAHVGSARVYSEVHPRRGRPRRLGELNPQAVRRSARVVRAART